MTPSSKITAGHLSRLAIVYVRQSTSAQVRQNTESTQRQYGLAATAAEFGWLTEQINDAGLRTGKNLRFTPRHVAGVRGIYQIFTPRTLAVRDGEISVKQAAQILGVPADAIYNWLRLGQVPASTRAGRWCIPWDAETQETYRQKVANSFRLNPNSLATRAAASIRTSPHDGGAEALTRDA